jgi:putative oxidoreductase
MNPILGRWNAQIYAIFRIVAGLLFAMHGTQKVLGFPPGDMGKPAVGSLPWISGAIELVCGLAIAIGLLTSLAAFLASGEMAVAYFMVHAKNGFWPILNKGELAVLYCFVFLYIAAHGAGIWSIDGARGTVRRR